MRTKRPGIVLAPAAVVEEVDPLTGADSRLFVGLPVRKAKTWHALPRRQRELEGVSISR